MVYEDEDLTARAREQFRKIQEEWHRLYMSPVGSDDVATEIFADDHGHSPPAIRSFVVAVLEEVVDSFNEKIQSLYPPEQVAVLAESDAYGYAMNAMYMSTRVLAIRCFEMGFTLREEVPFDKLVPCPCKVEAVDDALAKLFAEFEQAGLVDLEGKGWVIKNFDHNRAEIMKGKAHWLRKEV